MVLAVIIMTEGGVPVFVKEFSTIFSLDETRRNLVPSLISAITSFTREALGFEAQIVAFDSLYLHLVRESGLIICLVEDRENSKLFEIGRDIAKRIIELGITNVVALSEEEERKLEEEIVKVIRMNPPTLSELKGIYMTVRGFVSEDQCTNDFPNIKPAKMKIELENKTLSIDELANLILRFKPIDPKVFRKVQVDEVHKDLLRTLYILNYMLRFDYNIDLDYQIEKLYTVAMGISDDLFREIILARLQTYRDAPSAFTYYKKLVKYKEDILNKLKKGDLESKILFAAVFTINTPIYHVIGKDLERLPWLPKHIREILRWMRYRYESIDNFDEFMDEFSSGINSIEESDDPVEKVITSKKILVISKSIIRVPEVDEEILITLGRRFSDKVYDLFESFETINAPTSLKIELLSSLDDWIELLTVTGLYEKLKINLEFFRELAIKYFNLIKELIMREKIDRFLALTKIIKLVKLISVIGDELNTCYYPLLEDVERTFNLLTSEFIEVSWDDYLRYFLKLLTVFSFYASKITPKTLTRAVLNRINKYMDSIFESLGWRHPETFFNLVALINALWRSEDPTTQLIASTKIKVAKSKIKSPLVYLFDKIME